MTYLLDTDILSLLERRIVPHALVRWVQENEDSIFISIVSFAELEYGLRHAPEQHKESLGEWLAATRKKLAPATEQLTEPVLVRWEELLGELKTRNRTMTCEDSLIAATALFYGHTIVTRNVRHFTPCGASVLDPLSAN